MTLVSLFTYVKKTMPCTFLNSAVMWTMVIVPFAVVFMRVVNCSWALLIESAGSRRSLLRA